MAQARRGDSYADSGAFASILIGDGPTVAEAAGAINLVGGRILQRLAWPAVANGIDCATPYPILVAETIGIADADLIDGLAALARFADAAGSPVVVSLAEPQIDLVSALLFGPHVQPLCDPDMADRVAALAVAAEAITAPVLNDPWRESESSRLQRLNQEVARIADLLARLTRDEPARHAPDDVFDRRRSYDAGPGTSGEPVDAQDIRRMIRLRRLRDQFFVGQLFEDPAWDMLLDLYAAELEGRRVSVSSLCIAAAVAPTTALRWITKLTEGGLLVRHADPLDKRRAFMALAPQASEAMRTYFTMMERQD